MDSKLAGSFLRITAQLEHGVKKKGWKERDECCNMSRIYRSSSQEAVDAFSLFVRSLPSVYDHGSGRLGC